MEDQSEAECIRTGKDQRKHRESPHTGEDSTDSSALIDSALIKPVVRALRNREKTKRKAEASRQTGKCKGLKRPKLGDSDSESSIVCDEVKVQEVEFHVISRSISKISTKVLVPNKQRKSTKHNESTSPESTVAIDPEAIKLFASGGNPVYIQPGRDPTSTEGVLKAVMSEGSHTLSLDGKNITCSDTRFKEYKYELRCTDGTPKGTIYFYECCEYPGYYIRWYCGQSAVNCEPHKSDKPQPFEPQWKEFGWQREPANLKDNESQQTLQYSRLVACMPNSPDILSPYYMTFQDAQPAIYQSLDNAMLFLITPAKSFGSS